MLLLWLLLQDQTLQEVQNFAILSALAMSLGLAAVLVVDGADNWSGAYRQASTTAATEPITATTAVVAGRMAAPHSLTD